MVQCVYIRKKKTRYSTVPCVEDDFANIIDIFVVVMLIIMFYG